MVRSRGWCYTVNNYTDDDIAYCMSLYEDDLNASYQIIGFESGDRTGTLHLQCYIYYKHPVRHSFVANKMYPWHFEAQKAKFNVNSYCYCMEDGDYYEQGNRPRQGHRTDLEVIKNDIKTGVPMMVVANNYFSQWCQYRRSFDVYKDMYSGIEYDTQFHVYDTDDLDYSMRYIYSHYDMNIDLLIHSCYEFSSIELMSKFYSHKYRFIVIPGGNYPECVTKNISYSIIDGSKLQEKI